MKVLHIPVALAISAALAGSAHAALVFSLSGPTAPNQFLPLDLGMDFTVNSSFDVSELGAYTNGTTPLTVAIYALSGQTPTVVASAVIDSGPAGGGSNYVFAKIANIVLAAGNYQITVEGYGGSNGDYNPDQGQTSSVIFNSEGGALTQGYAYYNYPGTGSVATTLDVPEESYGNAYGAGTFGVPEPASWCLMILGIGLMGGGLRIASRKAVTAPL